MPKVILPEFEEELDEKKPKSEEDAPEVVIEKETITAEAPEEPPVEEAPEEEPAGEATPEDIAGKILSEGPRTAEDVLKLIEESGYELVPVGGAPEAPPMGPPSLGPIGILGPPNRMASLRMDAVKKAMGGR